MLLATALLLGCAGSLPWARAAGITSGAVSGPTSVGADAARRPSLPSRHREDERQRLLTAARGRGLRRSLHNPWVVVLNTRGGAFGRRASSAAAAAAASPPGAHLPAAEKQTEEGEASESEVADEVGSDDDSAGQNAAVEEDEEDSRASHRSGAGEGGGSNEQVCTQQQ